MNSKSIPSQPAVLLGGSHGVTVLKLNMPLRILINFDMYMWIFLVKKINNAYELQKAAKTFFFPFVSSPLRVLCTKKRQRQEDNFAANLGHEYSR